MAEEPEDKVRVELELSKDEVNAEQLPAKKDEEEKGGSAGEELKEALKAPVEPPDIKDKRPPNPHQKRVIIIGCALIIAGALLWPITSVGVALAVGIAGAVVIVIGTFVRI